MKELTKDILIMSYQFVGAMLFGMLFFLSNFGITSYTIKNISETTISIVSFLTLSLFFILMIYAMILIWRGK